MDFAFLPPEINSARMYSGPGSGPLLAAASGWDSVSAELSSTAQSYQSAVSQLTSLDWHGAASEAMAASVAQYISWLQTTAEQTKQAATQARMAAAAYEHAYALTVPPAAIAANRTRLTSLIATNFAGQNTAAIAATEAQYAKYWAQDTAAMSSYQASSSAATRLTPFVSPKQTTNANSQAVQGAPGTRAANNSATTSFARHAGSQANSSAGSTLSNPIVPDDFTALDGILAGYSSINATYNMEAFSSGIIGAESNLGFLSKPAAAAAVPALVPSGLGVVPGLASSTSSLGGRAGLGTVTASAARAGSVGAMSVPATWVAPSTSHVTAFEPLGMRMLPGTAESVGSGYPGYPGMPAGATSRASAPSPRYGARLTVIPRPPAAG
jgi:PPE-repeat protein